MEVLFVNAMRRENYKYNAIMWHKYTILGRHTGLPGKIILNLS